MQFCDLEGKSCNSVIKHLIFSDLKMQNQTKGYFNMSIDLSLKEVTKYGSVQPYRVIKHNLKREVPLQYCIEELKLYRRVKTGSLTSSKLTYCTWKNPSISIWTIPPWRSNTAPEHSSIKIEKKQI